MAKLLLFVLLVLSSYVAATGWPVAEVLKSKGRNVDVITKTEEWMQKTATAKANQLMTDKLSVASKHNDAESQANLIASLTDHTTAMYNRSLSRNAQSFPKACKIYSTTAAISRSENNAATLLKTAIIDSSAGGTPKINALQLKRNNFLKRLSVLQTQLKKAPINDTSRRGSLASEINNLKHEEYRRTVEGYQRIWSKNNASSSEGAAGFQPSTLMSPIYPEWFQKDLGFYKGALSQSGGVSNLTEDSLQGIDSQNPEGVVGALGRTLKADAASYAIDYLSLSRMASTGDSASKENIDILYSSPGTAEFFKKHYGITSTDKISERAILDYKLESPFLNILDSGVAWGKDDSLADKGAPSNLLLPLRQMALNKAAKAYAKSLRIEMLQMKLLVDISSGHN